MSYFILLDEMGSHLSRTCFETLITDFAEAHTSAVVRRSLHNHILKQKKIIRLRNSENR